MKVENIKSPRFKFKPQPKKLVFSDFLLNCDGGCYPTNPGSRMTWGGVIRKGTDRRIIDQYQGYKEDNNSTCNQAEYLSLIKGLQRCYDKRISSLTVFMDSKLIIYQMSGLYGVKSPILKPLHRAAKDIDKRIAMVNYRWIPREYNQIADDLT